MDSAGNKDKKMTWARTTQTDWHRQIAIWYAADALEIGQIPLRDKTLGREGKRLACMLNLSMPPRVLFGSPIRRAKCRAFYARNPGVWVH